MGTGHLETGILNSRSLLFTYHFAKLYYLLCLCPLKDSLPLGSPCYGVILCRYNPYYLRHLGFTGEYTLYCENFLSQFAFCDAMYNMNSVLMPVIKVFTSI